MVTNSENAAQSQRNVWSNVHEALNHTVLSSIVSPSYAISYIPPITLDRQEQSYTSEPEYNDFKAFLHQDQPQLAKMNDFHKHLFELRAKIEDIPLSSLYTEHDETEEEDNIVHLTVSQKCHSPIDICDYQEIENVADQGKPIVEAQVQPSVADDSQTLNDTAIHSETENTMDMDTQSPAIVSNSITSTKDIALEPDVVPMDIDPALDAANENKENAESLIGLTDLNFESNVRENEQIPETAKLAQSVSPDGDSYSEEMISKASSPDPPVGMPSPKIVMPVPDSEKVLNEITSNTDTTVDCSAFGDAEKHEVAANNPVRTMTTDANNPKSDEAISQEAPLAGGNHSSQANDISVGISIDEDNFADGESQDWSPTFALAPKDKQEKHARVNLIEAIKNSENVDAPLPITSKTTMTWNDEKDVALSNLRKFIQALMQQENELLQTADIEMKQDSSAGNLSHGDKELFIHENNQLLLSPTTTRRIAALVRKANKYNQLQNVHDEELSWVLKKLEKDVRKGLIDIQSERGNSQDYHGTQQPQDLNMLSIDRGADGAFTIFTILTSTQLDKKLYAEEVITSCLHYTKTLLMDIVSPLFESWNTSDIAELNRHCRQSQWMKTISLQAAKIINQLCRFVQQEDISDDMIITICYISIPPFFFHLEDIIETSEVFSPFQSTNSERPIDAIKVASLDVLRCIFAKYVRHRNWILDEILVNVVHMSTESENENSYRTSGGHTIHVVSALIFQLAQCTADSDRTKERNWTQKWELRNQKKNDDGPKLDATFINKVLVTSAAGIEVCTQTLHTFLVQLLEKCLKSSSQANTTLEYRRILDVFISDAMKILNEPEWPVAETIIRMFSTVLMETLDNNSSDISQRTLAIEYLGLIAGRIFRPTSEPPVASDSSSESLNMEDTHFTSPISQNDNLTDSNQLHISQKDHILIIEYLRSQITVDNIAPSALRYYILQWEYASASAWKTLTQRNQEENQKLEGEQYVLNSIGSHIKQLWETLLDINISINLQDKSSRDRIEVQGIVERLMFDRPLFCSYQAMLLRIFASLDSESVSQRSAALRALLNLSTKDISFMEKNHVHHSIIQRMQDVSPSVRDGAIKLAGNYLASHPEGTQQYYTAISERILDTSISVRKRVIRILRDIYLHTNTVMMYVDIGSKVIDRMTDDITAVRETALKASMETIFAPWTSSSTQHRNLDQVEYQYLSQDIKREVVQRCSVLLGIFSRLESLGNGTSLESLLIMVVDIPDVKRRGNMDNMLKLIIDCLFSELLQFEDAGDNTSATNCIGLIHCFAKSSPRLFNRSLMTMLEPYLKSSNGTDYKSLYYAIKIHDAVLPVMKRPDPLFLADTQLTLTKLLVNCPVLVLTAAISCLCTISLKLTSNYERISGIMYSCIGKLREEKKSVLSSQPIASPQRLIRLCLITGLLCQYCDFDQKLEMKDKSGRLFKLCQNGIASETFDLLYFFAANRVTGDNVNLPMSNQIKLAALQSLGYLYIQYPKFMVTKKSTTMMDEMFASRFTDYKSRVLHVFLDYLAGEEKRITEREKESSKSNSKVDVHKLLGNASEMAELSVSSSLMQRYLDRILQTALDANEQLRTLSFKVITQIVQQGQAHPVICMPVIVALETSPDQLMRDKAYQLHYQLNQRHQGLLYSRNIACVQTAYDYNVRLLGNASAVSGHLTEIFEYEALLQPMYSLIRDKRKTRNDFLSSVVKLFDIDLSESMDKDIYFFRFIAHNLVGMRYRVIEELLCIIFAINNVLSTTAMNLMSTLSLDIETDGLDLEITSKSNRSRRFKRRNELRLASEGVHELDGGLAMKLCLIMSILLLTKHVLKQTYSLTEEKCQQYHPEESNSFKTKAAAQQSAVVVFNQLLLQFPVFDTENISEDVMELACKHFAKLMMNDSLGTSNMENEKHNGTNQLDHQSSGDDQAQDDTQNHNDSTDLIDIIKRRN